jgi:GGDEF domain-containing protein
VDAAALPIGLAAVVLVSLVVLVDGLLRRRRLERDLALAWDDVPRDAETGLYDRRVCLQRIAAELKRARRGGGSVWVAVVTVLDGDADRFGRLLHDSMRLPEVGFRIGAQVVCVARPDLDEAHRTELLGRIAAAAPRERLAIGETTWRSAGDGNASDVLRRASSATSEVAAP